MPLYLYTEEGVDKVKDYFNQLFRVADKDPYEDWDKQIINKYY